MPLLDCREGTSNVTQRCFCRVWPVPLWVKVALTLQQPPREGLGTYFENYVVFIHPHSLDCLALNLLGTLVLTSSPSLCANVRAPAHTHKHTHTGFYIYCFYWSCVLKSLPGDCRLWTRFHTYLGGSSLEAICLLNANLLVLALFIIIIIIVSLLQGLHTGFLNQWRVWVSIFQNFLTTVVLCDVSKC